MQRRKREYKVPGRGQPIFRTVRWIFKLIYGCRVVTLGNPLPERAIYISNHSAKSGPISLEVSLPVFNVKWGAHEMLGGYKSRYNYLRNVLYIQKLGKGKAYATVKSFFEAIFSLWLYRGMKFLPTYTDIRFASTIRDSIKVLEANASVLIFPEDSNLGYFDELTSAFPGFVMLSERHTKVCGCELPIIPLYYSKKKREIYVGEGFSVSELYQSGMSREEIADFGKNKINELYHKYAKGDSEKES